MIEQIVIRDFKSIRNVTIDFDPVTVLVGKSGSGKSNIITAIRFLRDYLATPNLIPKQFLEVWKYLVPAGVGDSQPSVEVALRLPAPMDRLRFVYTLAFATRDQRIQLATERLTMDGRTVFEQDGKSWTKRPDAEASGKPGQTNSSWLYHRAMLGEFPTLPEAIGVFSHLTSGLGCYEFPLGVLNAEASGGRLENVPTPSGLSDDGTRHLDVLLALTRDPRRQRDKAAIRELVAQLNPSITSVELDSIIKPTGITLGHRAGARTLRFELRQESEGFRRFLAHLLALYQEPPKATLIFEEPENGIYPGALYLLAQEFVDAPKEGRGQVILTTHSPGLLDHLPPESIRVVEMRDGETVVGRVSEEQRKSLAEKLLLPGELLTVDPARLDDEAAAQPEGAGA